jgi:hypothetical protein
MAPTQLFPGKFRDFFLAATARFATLATAWISINVTSFT